MPRYVIAALLCLPILSIGPAGAGDCTPYCDYNHYYGPADLTYLQPGVSCYPVCGASTYLRRGLFCYPVCDAYGNCTPESVCVHAGPLRGRVTVRSLAQPARRR